MQIHSRTYYPLLYPVALLTQLTLLTLLALCPGLPLSANPAASIVYSMPAHIEMSSGGEATVKLEVTVPVGNHIYVAHASKESQTILIDFQIDPAYNFQVISSRRPSGKRRGEDYILEGKGQFELTLFDLKGRDQGWSESIPLQIKVQMCSAAGICYEPYQIKKQLLVKINAARAAHRDSTTNKINWQGTLAEARAGARQKGQNVFIVITAPWCGACRYLERNTFSDRTVQKQLNEKFVALRILDSSPEKNNFRIQGFPTLVVQDASGKDLYSKAGAMPPPSFLSVFSRYEREASSSASVESATNNAGSESSAGASISPEKQRLLDQNLIKTIYRKNSGDAAMFLEKGASASAMHGRWSALLLAVHFNQPEIVRQLLARGADKNYEMDGWTARSLAEASSYSEIAEILSKAGARSRSIPASKPPRP